MPVELDTGSVPVAGRLLELGPVFAMNSYLNDETEIGSDCRIRPEPGRAGPNPVQRMLAAGGRL